MLLLSLIVERFSWSYHFNIFCVCGNRPNGYWVKVKTISFPNISAYFTYQSLPGTPPQFYVKIRNGVGKLILLIFVMSSVFCRNWKSFFFIQCTSCVTNYGAVCPELSFRYFVFVETGQTLTGWSQKRYISLTFPLTFHNRSRPPLLGKGIGKESEIYDLCFRFSFCPYKYFLRFL